MEMLAHGIQTTIDGHAWKGIRLSRGGPLLSHIFFAADDLILFIEAPMEQVIMISNIMDEFNYCYG